MKYDDLIAAGVIFLFVFVVGMLAHDLLDEKMTIKQCLETTAIIQFKKAEQ